MSLCGKGEKKGGITTVEPAPTELKEIPSNSTIVVPD